MNTFDFRKYRPAARIELPDRQWPNKVLDKAPRWCAVDLRDGNQALIEPMTVEQKLELWDLQVKLGLKEIEIGFPSASQPDFDFARALIEGDRIPDDITIQVLVQAREHLIARTFEALRGAKRAIVHVYNSTNPTQRQYVFNQTQDGIKNIAIQGARWVREYSEQFPNTDWSYQYSPESFSQTEIEFATDVCSAVIEEWVSADRDIIINLPATVEVNTPNVFADQVEWFCRNVSHRDKIAVSLHTHNDRGCAVAAAELGVLAGADRIEGTLLGNGERTGNMDLVTMAMNLYSQGVDPKLDLSGMDEIIAVVQRCTNLPVHPRHPYAGELVFTAFSGSHQDAIRKCLTAREEQGQDYWDVAYLPIDPADLGRNYEAVIRINSQSGKGGVAYIIERDFGVQLPRWMQIEMSRAVQQAAEESSTEISPEQIGQIFELQYLKPDCEVAIKRYQLQQQDERESLQLELETAQGESVLLQGEGDGAISAMIDAISRHTGDTLEVIDYNEQAIGEGTDANAISYLLVSVNGNRTAGVATGRDVVGSSMQALLHACWKQGALSLSA